MKDALVFVLSLRMFGMGFDNDNSARAVMTTVITHTAQESSLDRPQLARSKKQYISLQLGYLSNDLYLWITKQRNCSDGNLHLQTHFSDNSTH